MSDLIDRQAAIDALGDAHFKNYGNAIMVIQDLPSAYPKKGKWIHRGGGIFTCSKCGKGVGLNVYTSEQANERFKFCPNCGADMR